ncbi:OprD family porin [Pseudomonas batumici]|uniref:Putative porin n=1 Tax=Pseudomonas batumici TaxID=226910 RepID=A0A0C2I8J0_9PSED|nr:putative porin [Pseudomonas batumici]
MKKMPWIIMMGAGTVSPLMSGWVQAAGFIEDSHADLTLRNFYISNDTRNSTTPNIKEWAQGFMLNYQSGFTQGTLGFGVDALGLLGMKLDSGGNATKAGRDRTPGVLEPLSNGSPVDEYASLGLAAKMKLSKTEFRYGTLQPKLPVIYANDGRLLPQTFEGGQVTSKEIDNLTLVGGRLEHAKARASTDNQALSIGGAGNVPGTSNLRRSNAFYYAGGDYQVSKNLLAQYYYGELDNFYQQHFFGLTHTLPLPVGSFKSDLRYFVSDSDGKNGSTAGRAEGYTSTGYYGNGVTHGKVDNDLFSSLFTYSLSGHAFSLGYQKSSGDSAMPFINQGDGASVYLNTDRLVSNFTRAGERTWIGQYAYDFAALGVPGLTSTVSYYKGDQIASATGGLREWERDLIIAYVLPDGPLKGLGVTWRNATYRSQAAIGTADADHNRLMISYSLPLF